MFQNFKTEFELCNTATALVKKNTWANDNGLIRSYKIAEIIAKSGSAHTVAETIVWTENAISMMQQDPVKELTLGNNLIQRYNKE